MRGRKRLLYNIRLMVFFRTLAFALFTPILVSAATISGMVEDSSTKAIPGASVQIEGGKLPKPLEFKTDSAGRYATGPLQPGFYTLRASAPKFRTEAESATLADSDLTVDFRLEIAPLEQELTVDGKNNLFRNSDPVYRVMREIGTGGSFKVENLNFTHDAAEFHLKSGTLTFLAPAHGHVTGAVFIGEGQFVFTPPMGLERAQMMRRMKKDHIEENFDWAVFRYTDATHRVLLQANTPTAADSRAPKILASLASRLRKRPENPRSIAEWLLTDESIDNVEADILASLYNPNRAGLFSAYIHGAKFHDLRFFIRPYGAVASLMSPDEVALFNVDAFGDDDGLWYLSHLKSELTQLKASSSEDKRTVIAAKYAIETALGAGEGLSATAKITLEGRLDGERVIKFHLLPNLRVSRVTENEKDCYFLQESSKGDGSFYVILREPLKSGSQTVLTVEYSGDRVLRKAGGGSFYVNARECWYPNVNGFGERSLYDLTFRAPSKFKVIGIGKLVSEQTDGKVTTSHWVTDQPSAVAGFNYGTYKKQELPGNKTGTQIDGYYLSELPDFLAGEDALASLSPSSMTKYALAQTLAQIQVCEYYFGKSSFDRLSITEQPNFNFGQSWPNLIYLPILAYIDSTQRFLLFGHFSKGTTDFVEEVTPHEVAHQWWGHTVGWSSYHDQWLSEGFAEFSAGLYLRETDKSSKQSQDFWNTLRKHILEKNQFGASPNDAGPVWMGQRLMSAKNESGYQGVVYAKGAYVLNMLKSVMWDAEKGNARFIAMMHDFVDTYRGKSASTEDFQKIAEKHMPKTLDFEHNGSLNWFFEEWVYGVEVPRYRFEYQIAPAEGGKVKVHATLSQSEVGPQFIMPIPVFGDFDGKIVRIGQFPVVGSSTRTFDFELPKAPKKLMLNYYYDILEST